MLMMPHLDSPHCDSKLGYRIVLLPQSNGFDQRLHNTDTPFAFHNERLAWPIGIHFPLIGFLT